MRISDWSSDVCSSDLLDRLILITVEQDRAIVAAEDHQRIVRDAERAELVHQRADGPVELDDRVAARPHARCPDEARMRRARDMRLVHREIEEEGRVPARTYEKIGRAHV